MKYLRKAQNSTPLQEVQVPIKLDASAHPGATVLGSDGRLYTSQRFPEPTSPYVWTSATGEVQTLAEPVTVRVGIGGEFDTLGSALSFFSTLRPAADVEPDPLVDPDSLDSSQFILGRIVILSGTVLREQIELTSVDLSWVFITSEDAVVQVDAEALVRTRQEEGAVFIRGIDSRLPILGTMFRCINLQPPYTQTTKPVGLSLYGSKVNITNADVDWRTLTGSDVAKRVGFDGFYENVAARQESEVVGTLYDIINGVWQNCNIRERSYLGGRGMRITGAGVWSVILSQATLQVQVNLLPNNIINGYAEPRFDFRRSSSATTPADINVADDARVIVGNAGTSTNTFYGTFNRPTNTYQKAGTIFISGSGTEGGTDPLKFPGDLLPTVYTTLGAPADFPNRIVILEGTGPVYSNGTDWFPIQLGAAL